MRIIAGRYKGKTLIAPPGQTTRPTADRARQALFDMIMHAAWGGAALMQNAIVLDGFAGTGALGLEALSRGAARAHFIEQDKPALAALRANIAACKAPATVWPGDMLTPPRGERCDLVFLDPPYGKSLIEQSLPRLITAGWIAPGTLILGEVGRDDPAPFAGELLAERAYGAAKVFVVRQG